MKLDFLTMKELDQLELNYKSRRSKLIIWSLVVTVAYVLITKLMDGLVSHSLIQGLYLGGTFVLVSFISETENKIRKIRLVRRG